MRYAVVLVAMLAVHIGLPARADIRCSLEDATIDGVTFRYGVTLEIIGSCVEEDTFDLSAGIAALNGVRINGRANQDGIVFHLFRGSDPAQERGLDVKAVEPGSWYKLRGKLADATEGGGRPACVVEVAHIELIPPAPLAIADFVDRDAELEGSADDGGKLQYGGDAVELQGLAEWPASVTGKTIFVHGKVRRQNGIWRIDNPTWKLVELEDQIDRDVVLDGRLRSLNDYWWFEYRDQRLCVTDGNDHPIKLGAADFARRARLSGRLVRQLRPSLDQIAEKTDRDLIPTFVVRRAQIKYLEDALSWEHRFAPRYPRGAVTKDGVPELVPEKSRRRNMLGIETTAMLFFERNEDAITRIGQALSEKSVDVMAHRMEDQAISEPLRLLYASILAAANDPRGRARLLAAAKDDKSPFFGDAVFCVAQSAFLIEPNAPIHTDMSWAETILIDLLPKQVPAWQGELQPAVTTAPVVGALLRVNTDRARRALIDFAASKAEGADEVRAALCDSDVTIAHDDLDRFDVAAKPSGNRRAVLNKMLRQDDPDVVARSCDDLADGFIYSSYREHLTPQIVSALRAAIPKAPDKCKSDMRMLVILASEDPVPEIVQLLEDPAWTDKNTALFELARIKDPRAVPIVGRILREAPPAYFHTDSALRANVAVEHALAAIANVATTEAARELATLFDVDLTRFGGYTDNNGFQRIIASHLIDITGESFGIDVEDWHKALR